MTFPVRSVTVRDRTGSDRNGVPLPATTRQLDGCLLVPRSSSESTDLRDTVIVGLTLFAPPGADVDAAMQVVVDGDVWEVDGEPGRWPVPAGWPFGVQVALKRQEG